LSLNVRQGCSLAALQDTVIPNKTIVYIGCDWVRIKLNSLQPLSYKIVYSKPET